MIDFSSLQNAIEFISARKRADPAARKDKLQAEFVSQFGPARERSVFVGDGYALRFAEARTGSFSNTVLSLSALRQHDHRPFVVVVVRERYVEFLLANSTFLKKISHSSQMLRIDNIKGSFNGSDIMTEYEGVANAPENFEQLFAQHSAFTWAENVERLVEATTAIVARNSRFDPTDTQKKTILSAPDRAAAALQSPVFRSIEAELRQLVSQQHDGILAASRLDNVNIRGNSIEQILTGQANAHDLGDLARPIDGGRLIIDVKTKLLDKASAPKAYNVDKMLQFLSEPGSVFAFLMLWVDVHVGSISTRLLPALENSVLSATVVQHHWAGRSSRGVTQLSGAFSQASDPNYEPRIDGQKARAFLGDFFPSREEAHSLRFLCRRGEFARARRL